MLRNKIKEYVKYCESMEYVRESILNSQNSDIKKKILSDETIISEYEMMLDNGSQTLLCLSLLKSIKRSVVLNEITDKYKDNMDAYAEFLEAQFNEITEKASFDVYRLRLLLEGYFDLRYKESLALNKLDAFLKNRKEVDEPFFMVTLGLFVHMIRNMSSVSSPELQSYLRKIALQVPEKIEFYPSEHTYLGDALYYLEANLEENQEVFQFWKNSEYESIADIVRKKTQSN